MQKGISEPKKAKNLLLNLMISIQMFTITILLRVFGNS